MHMQNTALCCCGYYSIKWFHVTLNSILILILIVQISGQWQHSCKPLKCWYTNVDSLSNKCNKLKSRLVIDKHDTVAVTEVNCKFSGSDVEFNIDG